jgi:hypothetical protein
MPTVPVRTIGTAPLPGVRVPTGAPSAAFPGAIQGGSLGEAIQPALSLVDRYQQEERKRANDIQNVDSDNQLADLQTQQETQIRARQGKDAMGALGDARTSWDAGVSRITSGLHTEEQRRFASARAAQRWQSLSAFGEQHAATEAARFDDESTSSALTTRINDAAAHHTDPAAINQAVGETQALLLDYGKRKGWGADITAQRTADQVSKIHTAVISRYLNLGDDRSAQTYYDANKEAIVGTQRDEIDRALETGSTLGESQRQADAIVKKGGTRTEMYAAAREIDDPKVRQATERELGNRFAQDDAAQRADYQQTLTAAYDFADKGQRPPTTLWTQLHGPDRRSVESYRQTVLKGVPVETNLSTYYMLRGLGSSAATRDQFVQTDLFKYRNELSPSDFKELVDWQAGLRSQTTKAMSEADGYQTINQVVDGTLRQIGLDPSPKPNDSEGSEASRVARFRRAVDTVLHQQEQQTGKKATAADAQRVVDDLVVRGKVQGSGFGGFFGTERFAFDRRPGEVLVFDVKDVPSADRPLIEEALRRSGVPVTPQSVVDLYTRYLNTLAPEDRPPLFRGTGTSGSWP